MTRRLITTLGLLPVVTALALLLGQAAPVAAAVSIWPATSVPGVADAGPGSSVELGVKFRADSAGTVNGIRFYKAAANTGTHTASLWSASGTRLATATFSGETPSGWQQVSFGTPVAITAGSVYVASYHAPKGHYSCDQNYFAANGVDNPPLHALAAGVSGVNGVYVYSSTSRFPSKGWNSSNYWVDVLFTPAAGSVDTVRPVVTAFAVPATATTLTVPVTSFTASDNTAVTGYLITESSATPAAGAAGWSTSAPGSYTFASAGGKTLYAWARDAAGNVSAALSAPVIVTLFSTGLEPAGWYAGDMHVHRSCGGSPSDIATLYEKMSAHNLAVMSVAADMGNGEVKDPAVDLPRVTGADDPLSPTARIAHWDAEWHWDATYTDYLHRALGGHVLSLGLSEAHQIWEEYTYPVFDWARRQNGIAGFVHMQYLDGGIPQTLDCCTPLEYPVEVALGSSDFIAEDVADSSYSGSSMHPEQAMLAYYRLLNCGFRPGLAAGTDYPCNGGNPPGALLTYARPADGQLSYRGWIEAIKAGRTVVSRNGHDEFLDLTVNGSARPGDELKLTGGGSVAATVRWTAARNLTGTVELVHNGTVIASRQASAGPSAPFDLAATVTIAKSGWLAARRMGANGHMVHTAAVFVTVAGAPVRASAADADFYVQWIDNLLARTAPGGAWSSYLTDSRDAARARYQQAGDIFRQIRDEAGGTTATGTSIFTGQVPGAFDNDQTYELGTRFYSDTAGRITQVRIYTNALEGGNHTVRIWRVADRSVAAGPYTWSISSGSTGWQGFTLPSPLTVTAGQEYIVAVSNSSSDRYYAAQPHGFDAAIDNGPLHTWAGSGVYSETAGAMPTSVWNNSNYFRDVVFVP